MGIPKFFRWLSDRYPLINQRLDFTHEFDNFYLDMNGIIHQCTHPNDDEIVVTDVEEMFEKMFEYTDRLYRIVKPQKMLFLAVDGVAPRAKMNQQRARRFRSAKDAERALAEAIARKENIPKDIKPFDSNCITPGTQFMHELSHRFVKWIDMKMSTDPDWQTGCNVVFSGSETPGEGEHKIMEYIRGLRESPEWTPTTRHCMYGLDADLIMLGLVTHEPNFTLLREKIKWQRGKKKPLAMQSNRGGPTNSTRRDIEEFELLELALLRDMIYLEFKPQPTRSLRSITENKAAPPEFDYVADRVVDDFIFMVMLVGNDFIPHIPNLDIAEGALNLMFRIYKESLPEWGGYLTLKHRLHPDRLESFFKKIAETERAFFETRAVEEGEKGFQGPGYKHFYYSRKLNVNSRDMKAIDLHIQTYIEGLHWVLQYYHCGCPSWNWFYPHLYAPLASNFQDLRRYKVRFQKGHPFRPLSQLLSVLPPESSELLPAPYRDLMINKESPIAEFYPTKFEVDPNGKKNAWEAVVLIPFIDETRLLDAVDQINHENLTPEERARDRFGKEHIFFARDYIGKRVYPQKELRSVMRSSKTTEETKSKSSTGSKAQEKAGGERRRPASEQVDASNTPVGERKASNSTKAESSSTQTSKTRGHTRSKSTELSQGDGLDKAPTKSKSTVAESGETPGRTGTTETAKVEPSRGSTAESNSTGGSVEKASKRHAAKSESTDKPPAKSEGAEAGSPTTQEKAARHRVKSSEAVVPDDGEKAHATRSHRSSKSDALPEGSTTEKPHRGRPKRTDGSAERSTSTSTSTPDAAAGESAPSAATSSTRSGTGRTLRRRKTTENAGRLDDME